MRHTLPTLLATLLAPMLGLVSQAHAVPADVLPALRAAIDAGGPSDAWLDAHVDPGPAGWTRDRRDAWVRALRPAGPLARTLARAGGILHTATRGADHAVLVLDTAPRLLAVLAPDGRVRHLRPTACDRCPEPERWVRDLLADLRAAGGHGTRLRVATDVEVSAHVRAHRALDANRWPALLDRRLRDDLALRQRIAGALVTGVRGDIVTLRYADGGEDAWTVTFDEGRGRLDYAGLPDASPLRLSLDDARAWRGTALRSQVRTHTWTPSWRVRGDGVGVEIGHAAVGAVVDPHDDTVLIVTLDPDRTLSAVFRVDPWTRAVVDRIPLPPIQARRHLPVPGWTARWPVALRPDTRALAVLTPDGVRVVDLDDGTITEPDAYAGDATRLLWLGDGRLVLGTRDGALRLDGALHPLGDAAVLHLAQREDGVVEAVLTDGAVVALDLADPASTAVRAVVCDGDARSAARRPRDGTWLIACGPRARDAHALLPPFLSTPERVAGRPDASIAAWGADGARYLAPAASGLGVWNSSGGAPAVGLDARPVSASFTPEGDRLVALLDDGTVVWWDLARLAARDGDAR